MNLRYQIRDCEVDFTEQTIVRAGKVCNLQYKVMKVLYCLLNKKGELVTIDELMADVWPNTVVSLNTLQRCIAQLRKGFGDTSQDQIVIKTYPRRGYALVAEVVELSSSSVQTSHQQHVSEHTNVVNKSHIETSQKTHTQKPRIFVISAFVCTVLFLLAIVTIDAFYTRPIAPHPARAHISSVMTASDEHTSQARYSPDGQYLIFQRYSDFCQSTVWLQHARNKQETALTELQKRVNDVAWSPEGKRLLVAQSNPCIAPSHNLCWQLELLTLNSAMQLQKTQPVGSCEHNTISQVEWLNEQSALLIEVGEGGRRQLSRIDVNSGQKKILFAQGDVLSFTQRGQQIAILSHSGSAQLVLFTVSLSGDAQQSLTLNYGDKLSVFSASKISYVANRERVQVENNGQLFEVLDNGDLQQILIVPNNLGDFAITETTIAATRGQIKQDGTLQDLNNDKHIALYPSKGMETYFRFAPLSESIAFVSNRTEELQVWVGEGTSGVAKQLTQFTEPVQINGLEWLKTGDELVLVVNDQLVTLTLAGELKTLLLPMRVKYLHQALSENQVLIEYQHDFQEVIAKVDLSTLQITPLRYGFFNEAQLDMQDTLWFTNSDYELYKEALGAVIPILPGVTVTGIRSYKEGLAISSKQNVLQYIVDGSTVPQPLSDMKQGSWLQDIDAKNFIWAYKHGRNSDIVELVVQY